jgi:chaperonin GroES
MKKYIDPFQDRVVIRMDAVVEKVTEGGIVVPTNAQPRPRQGIVLSVGPGKQNAYGIYSEMPIQVGDRVLVTNYGGSEVLIDGEEVLVAPIDEIIGKIVQVKGPTLSIEEMEGMSKEMVEENITRSTARQSVEGAEPNATMYPEGTDPTERQYTELPQLNYRRG